MRAAQEGSGTMGHDGGDVALDHGPAAGLLVVPVPCLPGRSSDGDDPVADGRLARRRRNAAAVLQAARSLLAEGHTAPVAQRIADRAGVSLRSVFRYYESLDQLLEAAALDVLDELSPPVLVPYGAAEPFDDRVGRLVRARVDRYETDAPTLRAVAAVAHRLPSVAGRLSADERRASAEISRLFAPELIVVEASQRPLAVALAHHATSVETWDRLRRGHRLAPDLVASAMGGLLRHALTPPTSHH